MKKLGIKIALSGIAVLCTLAVIPGPVAARTQFISIGTGGTGGIYYPYGGGVAEIWTKYVKDVRAVAFDNPEQALIHHVIALPGYGLRGTIPFFLPVVCRMTGSAMAIDVCTNSVAVYAPRYSALLQRYPADPLGNTNMLCHFVQ